MATTHTTSPKKTDNAAKADTHTADKLREAVTHAQDSAQDAVKAVRNTVSEVADRTVEHTQSVQGEFDTAVRRNPTLAVLGALGIGVALGLALNKRS